MLCCRASINMFPHVGLPSANVKKWHKLQQRSNRIKSEQQQAHEKDEEDLIIRRHRQARLEDERAIAGREEKDEGESLVGRKLNNHHFTSSDQEQTEPPSPPLTSRLICTDDDDQLSTHNSQRHHQKNHYHKGSHKEQEEEEDNKCLSRQSQHHYHPHHAQNLIISSSSTRHHTSINHRVATSEQSIPVHHLLRHNNHRDHHHHRTQRTSHHLWNEIFIPRRGSSLVTTAQLCLAVVVSCCLFMQPSAAAEQAASTSASGSTSSLAITQKLSPAAINVLSENHTSQVMTNQHSSAFHINQNMNLKGDHHPSSVSNIKQNSKSDLSSDGSIKTALHSNHTPKVSSSSSTPVQEGEMNLSPVEVGVANNENNTEIKQPISIGTNNPHDQSTTTTTSTRRRSTSGSTGGQIPQTRVFKIRANGRLTMPLMRPDGSPIKPLGTSMQSAQPKLATTSASSSSSSLIVPPEQVMNGQESTGSRVASDMNNIETFRLDQVSTELPFGLRSSLAPKPHHHQQQLAKLEDEGANQSKSANDCSHQQQSQVVTGGLVQDQDHGSISTQSQMLRLSGGVETARHRSQLAPLVATTEQRPKKENEKITDTTNGNKQERTGELASGQRSNNQKHKSHSVGGGAILASARNPDAEIEEDSSAMTYHHHQQQSSLSPKQVTSPFSEVSSLVVDSPSSSSSSSSHQTLAQESQHQPHSVQPSSSNSGNSASTQHQSSEQQQSSSILSLIDEYDSKIITNRTKAQLSCDSGEMILRLNFSEPFKGIVYPAHNRLSACRFFGDGHQHYELRLPLRGCGTRQAAPRVFVNDVIVRFHRALELEEDEVKTLICRYPPPLAPSPAPDGGSSTATGGVDGPSLTNTALLQPHLSGLLAHSAATATGNNSSRNRGATWRPQSGSTAGEVEQGTVISVNGNSIPFVLVNTGTAASDSTGGSTNHHHHASTNQHTSTIQDGSANQSPFELVEPITTNTFTSGNNKQQAARGKQQQQQHYDSGLLLEPGSTGNIETQSENLIVAPSSGAGGQFGSAGKSSSQRTGDLFKQRNSLVLSPFDDSLAANLTNSTSFLNNNKSTGGRGRNYFERLSSIELLFLISSLMFLVLLALGLVGSFYCFRRRAAQQSHSRASAILRRKRRYLSPSRGGGGAGGGTLVDSTLAAHSQPAAQVAVGVPGHHYASFLPGHAHHATHYLSEQQSAAALQAAIQQHQHYHNQQRASAGGDILTSTPIAAAAPAPPSSTPESSDEQSSGDRSTHLLHHHGPSSSAATSHSRVYGSLGRRAYMQMNARALVPDSGTAKRFAARMRGSVPTTTVQTGRTAPGHVQGRRDAAAYYGYAAANSYAQPHHHQQRHLAAAPSGFLPAAIPKGVLARRSQRSRVVEIKQQQQQPQSINTNLRFFTDETDPSLGGGDFSGPTSQVQAKDGGYSMVNKQQHQYYPQQQRHTHRAGKQAAALDTFGRRDQLVRTKSMSSVQQQQQQPVAENLMEFGDYMATTTTIADQSELKTNDQQQRWSRRLHFMPELKQQQQQKSLLKVKNNNNNNFIGFRQEEEQQKSSLAHDQLADNVNDDADEMELEPNNNISELLFQSESKKKKTSSQSTTRTGIGNSNKSSGGGGIVLLKSIEDSYITNYTEKYEQEYMERDSMRPFPLSEWRARAAEAAAATKMRHNSQQQQQHENGSLILEAMGSASRSNSTSTDEHQREPDTDSPSPVGEKSFISSSQLHENENDDTLTKTNHNYKNNNNNNLRSLTELDVNFAKSILPMQLQTSNQQQQHQLQRRQHQQLEDIFHHHEANSSPTTAAHNNNIGLPASQLRRAAKSFENLTPSRVVSAAFDGNTPFTAATSGISNAIQRWSRQRIGEQFQQSDQRQRGNLAADTADESKFIRVNSRSNSVPELGAGPTVAVATATGRAESLDSSTDDLILSPDYDYSQLEFEPPQPQAAAATDETNSPAPKGLGGGGTRLRRNSSHNSVSYV